MAINTTTRQTTAFTSGNNFAFAFKVYEVGDVKVIRITTSTGAEEVLTITTHYTVTLNDDQNANPGGTVILVSSGNPVNLGSGFNIVITSKVTPLQQTEITNQGGFFPEVINDVLDKAAILDQQQQSILDKTIRFPLTQTVGGLEITENAANRAGKVVQFDGSGDLTILGTVDGRDVSADGAKLDTIETNAKDDQTAAEIRALVESANDSNVFTDLDHSKLNNIEAGATGDQDAGEIKALYEGNSNTNAFTDAQVSKLANIEAGATGDQSASEIRTLVESANDSNVFTDNDHTKLNNIEPNATADQTATEIRNLIATSPLDASHLAANSVDSSELVNGSVDHVHLSLDCVDGDNIQDDSIDNEHIAANAVRVNEIKDGEITSAKLNPNTVITASEQASATPNDTSFLTSAAADARFFNISSGDTIKDGDTFPDNDTTIATTAAINDRIIDLVDDVGGFVPIANETSFPTANPDAENGTGTIVSVKAASTNLTPSGTTVTIANGAGTGNTVTITGVPSVIPAGFGFLVETTATSGNGSANPPRQYTFHRLVPKATEVTTVAGKATQIQTVYDNINDVQTVANSTNLANITAVAADASDIGAVAGKATEIGLLGTSAVITDMGLLGNSGVIADMNLLATSDVIADMNMLATSDVIADMALLAVTDVISDMNDLATSANITAMSTCSTNISSITNASNNISSVNNFGDKYQIASSDPSTDGGGNALAVGDLYFNTSANELKVYNGSSWQGGVTASGNFASTTGNTFTGSNIYNDNVKALFGTGSDLQIYHHGTNNSSFIDNTTGDLNIRGGGGNIILNPVNTETAIYAIANGKVQLRYDNSIKFETTSTGIKVLSPSANPDIKITGALGSGAEHRIFVAGSNSESLQITGNTRLFLNANDINFRDASTTVDLFTITSNGDVNLPRDNKKLQIGAGQDLQLVHTGTYSNIYNATGDLDISSDVTRLKNGNRSETFASFINNGQAEFYYDNNKKLQTTANGIQVTGSAGIGTTSPRGNLDLGGATNGRGIVWGGTSGQAHYQSIYTEYSSGSLILGAGVKGSTSSAAFLAPFTGTLAISVIELDTFGSGGIKFYTDGNSSKTAGNTITPTQRFQINANGDLKVPDNGYLYFGAGNDLGLYSDGSTSYIKSNDLRIKSWTGGESYIECALDGAVKLYFDNSKKFQTENAGVSVFGNLYQNDDYKLILGNSSDLEIYHSSSNAASYIQNSTGNLFIEAPAGSAVQLRKDGTTEVLLKAIPDGAVELYHNNSKKFETTSNGVSITGVLNLSDNLDLPDNAKVVIGTGDDLKIYSDGSTVFYAGDDQRFRNKALDENMLTLSADGSVVLFHNGSNKLQTTSSGVTVTGTVAATSFTGDGSNLTGLNTDLVSDTSPQLGGDLNTNGNIIKFPDATGVDVNRCKFGTGNDLHIYHNASDSMIRHEGTGDLNLQTTTGNINLINGAENMLVAKRDGAVELYYDNSKKLETRSNGASMGAVTHTLLWPAFSSTSPSRSFGFIGEDGQYGKFELKCSNGNDSTLDEVNLRVYANAEVHLLYDNALKFYTASDGTITAGHSKPASNNSYDLGSSSYRWRNVYTNDLNLSNEGSSNDVDGTWGSYTIQEGAEDLFLINKRNGKKYKFALMEVS